MNHPPNHHHDDVHVQRLLLWSVSLYLHSPTYHLTILPVPTNCTCYCCELKADTEHEVQLREGQLKEIERIWGDLPSSSIAIVFPLNLWRLISRQTVLTCSDWSPILCCLFCVLFSQSITLSTTGFACHQGISISGQPAAPETVNDLNDCWARETQTHTHTHYPLVAIAAAIGDQCVPQHRAFIFLSFSGLFWAYFSYSHSIHMLMRIYSATAIASFIVISAF